MKKKADISKKLLQYLADRSAVPVDDLKAETAVPAQKYAVTRALKNLEEGGLVESLQSERRKYVRLTKEGRQRLHSLRLDAGTKLVSPSWDGKWRVVLLDIPESRKSERESLRYLLKKAGFVMLKNSAWISPYPFEHLFGNIKKDLGLSTEIMVFVTDSVDPETEKELYALYSSL